MSRIFWIIVIVVVVIFGAVWYANRSRTHAVNSGDVFVRGQAGDKTPETALPSGSAAGTDQGGQQTAAPGAGTQADGAGVVPPANESMGRNPPNGMLFAGSGKYQLYRQGDITWRLNTDSGQACVLFATDAEWHKVRVFQQGCGAN